ncbi:MAG TPA: UDP-N-acetylglucosamine 2-epimerase (non-hydrolyzing) [Candidatus Binatia bacterium]|nr:UDP-N-acetylglucosamine 2-epimerase (non-hydrolyzing) [Candidatus Binatia bacterium]
MRLLTIVGTRPEAIKMAPLVAEARRRGARVVVCATAQHRRMLDQVLELFDIRPDHDLDLMRPDQTLADLTARAIAALDPVVARERPDWVLVQGDTTTAMVGALVAFYRGLPVGHVEAGLRTGDLRRPFPEELNRRVADIVAAAHFAPTAGARAHLEREGVDASTIHVTGNTVVDALEAVRAMPPPPADVVPEIAPDERLVVVTAHRRESFGPGMAAIARALARIAREHADVRIVYPVHPNPNVVGPMREILGTAERVHLVEPLAYLPFVHLMARAYLVISDSGGVQEEAPSLGVPALVLREVTERPEAIEAGAVRLVGVDSDAIAAAAGQLLRDREAWSRMARVVNPYGDGRASERIVAILRGEPWTPFVATGAT